MNNKNKHRQGFSLLEALLTTTILSGLLFVLFGLLQNYSEQVVAKSAANYIVKINNAVKETLSDPNNYQAIYTEVDNQGNDILEITIADILNGRYGGVDLADSGVLNRNIGTLTPFKTTISVMLRRQGTDALEIIIATNDRVDDKRVRRAAEYLKLAGGFYRNTTDNVKHAYNAWGFNPGAYLANTTWWNANANPRPPSIGNGSYLISYEHITFDEVVGDYLYRLRTAGRPELNTLYTDLNMGGQNITGADDVHVEGDANFQSNATVKGALLAEGDVVLNNSNFRAFNRLETENATINNVPGGTTGNFTVQGTLNTTNLEIQNQTKADQAEFSSGFSTTGNISVDSIEANIVQSDNLSASQIRGASASDRIGIYVDGGFSSGILTTSQVRVDAGGNPISEQLTVNGNINADTISSPEININNLNTNVFGLCDDGDC